MHEAREVQVDGWADQSQNDTPSIISIFFFFSFVVVIPQVSGEKEFHQHLSRHKAAVILKFMSQCMGMNKIFNQKTLKQ
jgi:hypothetical protein